MRRADRAAIGAEVAAFGELQAKLGRSAPVEIAVDALVIESDAPEAEEAPAALQRESAWVNELNGVVAHLVGALHEVLRCESIEAAKTFAEMAIQSAEEHRAGLWTPGPHDDPADWRGR